MGVRNLKIAMTVGSFRDRGTYHKAYFLGRELARKGHDVTILCISPRSQFVPQTYKNGGLKIVECPNFLNRPIVYHGVGPLDIFWRLKSLLSDSFDIVHGFQYFADVTIPILLARRFRAFLYVSDWSDWFARGMDYSRFASFRFLPRIVSVLEDYPRMCAQGVTVISQTLYARVLELGLSSDKILHVPHGAPIDLIQPVPKEEARTKLGIDVQCQIIGYLGTSWRADLDLFVEPFAVLCRRMPNLRFLLIGQLGPRVQSSFVDQEVADRVIEAGWVEWEQLPLYLAAADVCVLPLRKNVFNESRWPGKIGEYLAAGRPIVASAVGEVRHIVKEGGMGFLVDNTVPDIVEKLTLLLSAKELADCMGRKARTAAETRYAWHILADDLESFYFRLLQGG